MPGNTACLLVHGFGGAPFEMEPLVGPLREVCAEVAVPTLPGHDTSVSEFVRTTFDDWYAEVRARFDDLAARHERVFVVGMSMGGTLGLRLAEELGGEGGKDNAPKPTDKKASGTSGRLAGLVTIASPVYLYRFYPFETTDWRLFLLPILRRVRPLYPIPPRKPETQAIAPWRGYEGVVALEPLASFMEGMRKVRRDLPKVTCPVLSIHCPTDGTSPASCAWDIQRHVSSDTRRLVLLPIRERVTHHHLLTTHRETKGQIVSLVLDFLEQVSRLTT
jgi:carboxylesterase